MSTPASFPAQPTSPTIPTLIAAHRNLVLRDEAMFDDNGRPLRPILNIVESEAVTAYAFDALLAAPCRDLADVRAKVDYLLNGTAGNRQPLLDGLFPEGEDMTDPAGPLVAFLRSFLPAPVPLAAAA